MHLKNTFWLLLFLITTISCKTQSSDSHLYESETLKIKKVDNNCYIHISYLQTDNFGRVGCNGLIYVNKNEAVIFDTPSSDEVSSELIEFVQQELQSKVRYVVINHSHVDCLGGLQEFHNQGITSCANNRTIALAEEKKEVVPQKGFDTIQELKVGGESIINEYIGEGHTSDNIVSYIPSRKVLFGGCLIKSLKSGKGNLADANTKEWSATVAKVKAKYPKLNVVIPGHGKRGSAELLEYTIEMFAN